MSPAPRLIVQHAASARLELVAGMVLVLNLVDAIFTLVYTRLGVAHEANPLMQQALMASPLAFMAVKLALVSLGVLLLWRARARRVAVAGLVAAGTTYTGLVLYHLSAVHLLAPRLLVAG